MAKIKVNIHTIQKIRELMHDPEIIDKINLETLNHIFSHWFARETNSIEIPLNEKQHDEISNIL